MRDKGLGAEDSGLRGRGLGVEDEPLGMRVWG